MLKRTERKRKHPNSIQLATLSYLNLNLQNWREPYWGVYALWAPKIKAIKLQRQRPARETQPSPRRKAARQDPWEIYQCPPTPATSTGGPPAYTKDLKRRPHTVSSWYRPATELYPRQQCQRHDNAWRLHNHHALILYPPSLNEL